MISLGQPHWLVIGTGASILFWLLWYYFEVKRKQSMQRFVSSPLLSQLAMNVSARRRGFKKLLFVLVFFCCFAALARPQYGYRWVDVKHKGIDILIALDTSKSMGVEDIRPNRLERSKLGIMDFVSQLEGDRVGLMPFAGSSYLMCPLTADYHAFEQSLNAVDTSLIPTGGTNLSQAIKAAEKTLSNDANHKILILITDGENLQGDAMKAAATAHENDMAIYTVGVGTAEGELIPDAVNGGFIKDSGGAYVKSRLDEKQLKAISEAAGGFYVPLGNQGEGLETIYQQKLTLIPKTELTEKRKKLPIDRYEWVVAVALVLLCAEFLISGRKQTTPLPRFISKLSTKTVHKSVLLFILNLLLFSTAPSLEASEGKRAYEQSLFLKAQEYYQSLLEKDPQNPLVHYNVGTTAYKNNLFDEAHERFSNALSTDDPSLQEKAYFNLGNVNYRKGEETLSGTTDQQTAITQWEEALSAYQAALALNPENAEAQHNHEYVKSRLDQLKQQQNKDQQSSQDQQNQEESEQQQSSSPGQQDQNSNQQQQPSSEEQAQPESKPEQNGNKEGENQQHADKETAEKNAEQTRDTQQSDDKHNARADEFSPQNDPTSDTLSSSGTHPLENEMMSPEEAMRLLQTIQNEEGRLNLYHPVQEPDSTAIRSDW